MRAKIATYYIASCLALLLLSLLLPASTSETSILGRIDKAALFLLPDSASVSAASIHPVAIRVSYLVAVALAVIGALVLAAIVAGKSSSIRLENQSSIRISSRFLLFAAILLAAIPFLPLLPTGETHLFRALEMAIQRSRVILGLWNVVFFVGYSMILLFVFLGLTSLYRSRNK